MFYRFIAVAGWTLAAGLACMPAAKADPIHTISAGVVVFEAEHFAANLSPRGDHAWTVTNAIPGFSGSGYIESLPNNGTIIQTNLSVDSPELQYEVLFRTNLTHYVWVRAYATNGADDSIQVGRSSSPDTSKPLTWATQGSWVWTNSQQGSSSPVSFTPGATNIVPFSLWMREDGARIDRVVITTNPDFKPRKGNAWHIPHGQQPAGATAMRTPFMAIFSNSAVTIYSGNQYQGAGEAGNQLASSSTLFFKHATGTVWQSAAMSFHSTSGNNIHYSGTIPAYTFKAGDVVQYYLRIPYSDYLPTYLYGSNGQSAAGTELESVAQASPYSYTVMETPAAGRPSPDDWRDINIYQIFTDRFFDGDPSNNNSHPESGYNPSNSRRIHGGDFKGIEQKLDYIKALGANAIWISPIVLNAGDSAYHGYGAHDFYQIAPQMGTISDLTSMVASAHAKGIYVIVDIVCNHQGTRIDSTSAGWSAFNLSGYTLRWTTGTQYPPPFNQLGHFHNNGHIGSYTDPEQILGELSGLDDLRTEDLHVRTNMVHIYNHWIALANLDGFRIDTVKHVETGFWQFFNPEIRAFAAAMGKTNFFQFGEVYDGSEAKMGSYTGTQAGGAYANDSVKNFALCFKVNGVFAQATGNTKQIEDHYHAIPVNIHADAQMRLVNFLDNHDFPRFMYIANNNTNRLAVALTFLYSSRGIPSLYYGTEQNFNGSGDPGNREDMWNGQFVQGPSVGDNFNMTQGSFLHVAKLNNFRRLYPSLRRGSHVNLWNNPSGPGLFAYARRLGAEEVFVVFNTASSSQNLTTRPSQYAPGTLLVNLLNTNEFLTVTENGEIPSMNVPGTSAKLFIAASLHQPLDPVVEYQSPAHAASNTPPQGPIVLHFSKPMATNATEAAFQLDPPANGAFSWSADRRELTFTPNGGGLAGHTTYALRVDTNAMDRDDGNNLYAAFETFFITATSTFSDVISPQISISQPASGAVITGLVTVAGVSADDIAVDRVEFRLDNGPWSTVTGTASWSLSFNSEHFLNGTHLLTARAVDTAGNVSSNTTVEVRFFNVPGEYERRISPGNPSSVTHCDDTVWIADQPHTFGSFGYVGGVAGFLGNSISGVCAQAQSLYQRERYSDTSSTFDYWFDCPPGLYEITLLEAETWVSGAGQRIFDVYIEGERMLADYDIYAEAGGRYTPITLIFTSVVADARLEMHFVPRIDNARASGIQVIRIGDTDTDGDGIPDWWMLGHFDHPTGQDADQTLWWQDADSDGYTNIEEWIAGTDPNDPASYPALSAITHSSDPTVQFRSALGRLYAVEATTNLLPPVGPWVTVEQDVPGSGGDVSITDTNQFQQRYYRLRITRQEP